jgi:hypothetical protein
MIGLCLRSQGLQIQDLLHTLFGEDVMAGPNSFIKTQMA